MKVKRKILIMISTLSLLFVGCSNTNNNQNTKVESTQEQNQSNKSSSDDENIDIEHHIPYANLDNGEVDEEVINERYRNVNKDELRYDTIEPEMDAKIAEHNANPNNLTKIYKAEDPNEEESYKSILEGYSYNSEGNSFEFTYDEAIELVKTVLPDDIEEVRYILNNENNTEYKYYISSKGNFRVELRYLGSITDKDINEIHKYSVSSISYCKEFK